MPPKSTRTRRRGVRVDVEADGDLIVTNLDQVEMSDRPIRPKLQQTADFWEKTQSNHQNLLEHVGVVVGFDEEAEKALTLTNHDQAEMSDRSIKPKLQPFADHPDCDAKEPTLILDKCPTDSDSPNVYITPRNSSMYVHRHGNMTLECAFLSLTSITSSKWIKHGKNGQTVLNKTTHPDKFSVSLSEASRNLLVFKSDFILDDAGTYQCIVSNENGENDDNVTVLIYEEIPNPQVTSELYPLNLGEDVHMECMIDVYPEVTDVWWTKDDGIIDITDSQYRGSTPQEPSVHISTTTTDDIGYYRCCANNSISFNCSNYIILGFLFHNQSDKNITFGERITIDCAVESYPPITNSTEITWSLNGSCVNTKNIIKYTQPTLTSLTIKNATFGDQGEYTCDVEKDLINGTSGGFWLNVNGDVKRCPQRGD
ncbi:muscle M-line assembly protein unc-89-like [Mytilus trossulus]|uniref:muscle M-line assembly protein unc-89-like n=1 Tax=Mytilus trossulus TaxID=6551 RepID=UPI0030052350